MKRIGFFLTIIAFIMIASFSIVIGSNRLILEKAEPYISQDVKSVDAIIVLGAFVRPNGSLSPMLRERLETGLELYKEGIAPKILVTGDHGTAEYNEVQAMKKYLLANGVAEADVFMDHAGFDTYDSMFRARDVFKINKAVAVSQDFHVPRAVYIGRSLGMEVWGADDGLYYPWWFKAVMREWLARTKAAFDVELLHPKPKFLGPVIPITGDGRQTQD